MQMLFLFLLLSLPLLYLLMRLTKNRSRFSPPGSLGLPIIGNLHQIQQSSLHTSLRKLSDSYGPIVSLNLGFIPAIVVSSASLAKEVLKTQDINFCRRPSFVGTNKLSYNNHDVSFSPYNEYWREMKKIFTLHLGPKKVESFRYIREDEVFNAMNKIHELTLSSKPVNLSDLMKSVASTIMMSVAFGKNFQDEDARKEVLRHLPEVEVFMADIFVSDMWHGLPFMGLIDRLLGKMDRLDKCFEYFDEFFQDVINEHINSQNFKFHEEAEQDFVDILLRLKEDQIINLTYDHIKAVLMDVLAAGTDTSSATVVWAMTALIKNSEVMKRAQEEVRNMVGKKGKVDEDDLPKLTYLKAVVKDT
ncbi:hypothetical protein LXL04_008887 [Taraxacum kok-saghyz]